MIVVNEPKSPSRSTASSTGHAEVTIGRAVPAPLKKYYIERHVEGQDTRVYIWGEEEPGFVDVDHCFHVGVKVEIDGKLVYIYLKDMWRRASFKRGVS